MTNEILSFIAPFLLPLSGVVVGAWLSNSVFPFKLRRREWRWDKEVWARELVFEHVSRISFVAEHYFKGEYDDQFSMSGLTMPEADREILSLIKDLHQNGHKIRIYLDKKNAEVFDNYLVESQNGYDHAKETWNQWMPDDDMAEIGHTENTISEQGKVASEALRAFKLSS